MVDGFAAAEPAFDPRALVPGSRLGKYEVIRRLAVGGMAELYLARALGISGFEKLVALKRVHPHLATDAKFIRMFLNEARLAATLDHPNLTQVMDIGVVDGEHFFTMEYLHGEDLREILQQAASTGPLPLECAIEVVMGVARGLHHAHERTGSDGRPLGLVHRDVSPSNVFVTYEGGVKVVDFGIAKAGALTKQTQEGTLKGKVGYMSPEQCQGSPVDRRSDVFALGILLYEVTTGRRLFFAESQYAVLNKIIEGRYAAPSELVSRYPAELETIVERALKTDVDERYPTAEALQLALEDFAHETRLRCSPNVLARYLEGLIGHRPYPTADIPLRERPIRTGGTEVQEATSELEPLPLALDPWKGRRRSLLTYGAVGVVALVAGLGVGGLLREEPRAAEATGNAEPTVKVGRPEPAPLRPTMATGSPEADEEASDSGKASSQAAPAVAEPEAAEPKSKATPSRPQKRRSKSRGKSRRPDRKSSKSLYPPSYYE